MNDLVQSSEDDLYLKTAKYYDHIIPYRHRKDVQFFIGEARGADGPVLELGCGTGRVLLPTAEAGIEITGLDSSKSMLQVLQEKLEGAAPECRDRVSLVHEDMRNFMLSRKFALITTPFRPFQHLTEIDDQLATLECVRQHLAPSGKFILDLFNPMLEKLAGPVGDIAMIEEPFTMPNGDVVVRKHRFLSRNLFTQVMNVDLIHEVTSKDGTVMEDIFNFDMRWFYRYEIEHLLARAGLSIEAVYSDYDRSPYGAKYPGEMIVVARLA